MRIREYFSNDDGDDDDLRAQVHKSAAPDVEVKVNHTRRIEQTEHRKQTA